MWTVLYFRGSYLNPTYSELYGEFSRRASADLRVIDINESSIEAIRESIAESDAIVVSDMIFAASFTPPAKWPAWIVPRVRTQSFYDEVASCVNDAQCPSIMVSFSWDLHVPAQQVFPLDPRVVGWVSHQPALAWLYEHSPVSVTSIPPAYRDVWMESAVDPRASWQKVVDRFPARVELPFCIGPAEFRRVPARPVWDLCVAGVAYATRKIAVKSARAAALSRAPYQAIVPPSAVVEIAERRLPDPIARRIRVGRIKGLQLAQRALIARSRVNFVCGSGYQYPVRKFFEVPALHSAMVAYPCRGFEDYGFIDGENVVVSAPEDAGRAARALVANPALRESIARRGWEVVHRLHSVEQRVTDLLRCVERVQRGAFRSARFVEGRFEIV